MNRPSHLQGLDAFGSNPGQLNAWMFTPERAGDEKIPLVVVLHGCTQNARDYDMGSGWSKLAEAYGFAVLFPEQQRSNNGNLCFNWFEPDDTRRGSGEALSIAQMIEAMIDRRQVDRQRVFITGLSAGGAMTSVMLATYPEMFAGGAILAGLPHGAASSVGEALQQMRSHSPTARTSGRSIKAASRHQGRWPVVSIWHGTADAVVSSSNADAILQQWKELHALPDAPTEEGLVDGQPRRAWHDAAGKLLVEEYRVTGMGHGTPLATAGESGFGQAGAFMLEVGISSTVHSARTWGLLGTRRIPKETGIAPPPPSSRPDEGIRLVPQTIMHAGEVPPHQLPVDVSRIINDALRAAGLMK
jgi:poly(hydroxyalkanoate) depolymerase family esterase